MLDELERILAQLYDTNAKARHVVDRAGMPAAQIDMDGAMRDVWHSIVSEAIKRRQLLELVRVVTEDYPQRAELKRVRDNLVRTLDDGGYEERMSDRDPERLRNLERIVARMSELLKGSEWGDKGLVAAVERLEIKVDDLSGNIARIIDNQRLHRRVVASLSVICALLLIAVVTLAYVIATAT